MSRDDELFYLGAGPVAAIGLGAALIPLRGSTTASNLAFAFVALTIVVGHAGGRWAATATAIASALSLNFFLTRPYLTLTIHGRDDVIAFVGLAACGLVSAALGSGSTERLARRRQLDVLYSANRDLELSGPPAARVQALLESACAAFPVSALVLHDDGGELLGAVGDRARVADVPRGAGVALLDDAGVTGGPAGRAAPLPREGVRLPLVVGRRALGHLDLWGDGRPAGPDTRRTLRAFGRALAALLAAERYPLPAPAAPERAGSAWIALPGRGEPE
jgi:K+-sensing histidine kinase KdpD